jgi:Flp pilus assembly protein TadG
MVHAEEPEVTMTSPGMRPNRCVRRRRGGRRGQAMVELALTFPLLLSLAVSIADYGYYLEHVNNIATVVRDGARFASQTLQTQTGVAWSSACPAPTWSTSSGRGGWTCAGLSTTVASGSNNVDITGAAFQSGTASVYVSSIAGFAGMGDFSVTTTTSGVNGGPAVIACTGTSGSGPTTYALTGCDTDSGSGLLTTGESLLGSSDFTQGVIQEEAESLTVPEGGLPLDNIDCCWAGSTGGGGCPSGSGTTPVNGGTVKIPSSWPSGVTASGSPVSCMTVAYWNSSDGTYSTSSLGLCGWWSSDAGSDTGQFQSSGGCTAAAGELVQVTVAYAWSQSSPGPVFTVLNSSFGISLSVISTYSFVVTA